MTSPFTKAVVSMNQSMERVRDEIEHYSPYAVAINSRTYNALHTYLSMRCYGVLSRIISTKPHKTRIELLLGCYVIKIESVEDYNFVFINEDTYNKGDIEDAIKQRAKTIQLATPSEKGKYKPI